MSNRDSTSRIDFDSVPELGEQRHTQRKVYNVPQRSNPATIASIASPMRGRGNESPRYSKDAALFAETSTNVGPVVPRSRPPSARRPPMAPSQPATHDKSLPNARRSQRSAGTCQPAPELTSAAALAASASMLAANNVEPPGRAFAADAVPRRGRGVASPTVSRPVDTGMVGNPYSGRENAPPTDEGRVAVGSLGYKMSDLRSSGYIGVVSGGQVDNLLGGRRGRGMCSPRPQRANPLAWDTE